MFKPVITDEKKMVCQNIQAYDSLNIRLHKETMQLLK